MVFCYNSVWLCNLLILLLCIKFFPWHFIMKTYRQVKNFHKNIEHPHTQPLGPAMRILLYLLYDMSVPVATPPTQYGRLKCLLLCVKFINFLSNKYWQEIWNTWCNKYVLFLFWKQPPSTYQVEFHLIFTVIQMSRGCHPILSHSSIWRSWGSEGSGNLLKIIPFISKEGSIWTQDRLSFKGVALNPCIICSSMRSFL